MLEEFAILAALAILVIVAVDHFSPRLGVAAPVLLVIVGITASYVPGTPDLHVDPHLVLAIILPPILYSAAITVPAADFRRNFKAISALAVVLVLVSAFVTGFVLHLLLPDLNLAFCIALGAVISPPDAVAATAVGKRLGLPPRLVTVLEGEGLVNDATALVMLRSAVAAGAGAVSFWGVASDFVFAVVVGTLVGVVVGWISVRIRSKVDDPVLTTAVSLTVPFVAFVPAEELHASGVLAVVVAGLITGHQSSRHFSAQERLSERINWRTIQVLLENGVFLLMGYQMQGIVEDVGTGAGPGVAGSVAFALILTAVLVLLRIAFMVPLVAWLRRDQRRAADLAPQLAKVVARLEQAEVNGDAGRRSRVAGRLLRTRIADAQALRRDALGWRGGAVLAWSGMRGVITLAAAQSLPASTPYRSQLILIAFTVALLTLIGQGVTLPVLIRRLGIRGTDAEADRRDVTLLIEEITTIMGDTLDNPDLHQADGKPFDSVVIEKARAENDRFVERLTATDDEEHVVLDQKRELRRLLLEAGQAALLDARTSGTYASRSVQRVQAVLDAELFRLDAATADGGH